MVPSTRPFDYALEGLRGVACLIVLICHMSLVHEIDPQAPITFSLYHYFILGKEGVLIFFLISGYVIGLTCQHPYSSQNARNYLWKRFVRLVPLCWLAIILSASLRPIDSATRVIGSFFLLNNINRVFVYIGPLRSNSNLWSLNFELVYYLAFLLIWRYRPNARQLGWLIVAQAALALSGWFISAQPRCIAPYALGGVYWCLGLWLAWYGRPVSNSTPLKFPWISLWLLFIATAHLTPILNFFRAAGWNGWVRPDRLPYISVMDFQMLPICLVIFGCAISRQLPFQRAWWATLFLLPLSLIGYWAISDQSTRLHEQLPLLIMLAGAILLWPVKFSNRWLTGLSSVGLISYGIYIFGRPMEWLVIDYLLKPFSGTVGTYFLRVTFCVILTIGFAYLAERIWYPRLKRYLDSKWSPSRNRAGQDKPAPALESQI